jgi:DNA polymerase III delta subunit
MKKNIILLTGTDTYGIEQEVKRWIRLFGEKHSDLNIEHIYLNTIKDNGSTVAQNILSGGLFAEKRLFIVSGGNDKRDKTTDFVAFFESILTSLPDDHFLLFHALKERWVELEKILVKIWDVKRFGNIYSTSLWEGRFPDLDTEIIKKVLKEYEMMDSVLEDWEKNMSQSHIIASTLENLALLALSKQIHQDDIDAAIWTTGWAKIFDLIDAINNLDIKKALSIFDRIAGTKSMFEFLPSYIWLLRSVLYIKYLDSHRLPTTSIKVHPYVLGKTLRSKISYPQISKLYKNMVQASIAYKSGKWMKDVELWRIFEIELGIIWLKK